MNLLESKTYFFIGVAGVGMSALAQFLAFQGKEVLGSDRLFTLEPQHPIKKKLSYAGIKVFPQGQAQIPDNATVIVSSAIEENVPELIQAKNKNLPIYHRSDLLAAIASKYNSIAVAGTSGKSTTTAMIFHILRKNGIDASIINGASLIDLMKNDKLIGNAYLGKDNWLVFEADESDGTITKYQPTIGVILNIDLDHKDLTQIKQLFQTFAQNSKILVKNSNINIASTRYTFCIEQNCFYSASNIKSSWQGIEFTMNNLYSIKVPIIGEYNVQNALAAISAATAAGLSIPDATQALKDFRGLHRRMQIVYRGIDFTIIDDYAHNPAKIKAAIQSAQKLANQVIAWFQPHGYSPLKLFGDKLVQTIASILRPQDIFVMSPVYYVGGTAPKDICAKDYIDKLKNLGVKAEFLKHRKSLPDFVKQHAKPPTVILLMGARDPMLDFFANYVSNMIIYFDGML